jgi:hypothetical protein
MIVQRQQINSSGFLVRSKRAAMERASNYGRKVFTVANCFTFETLRDGTHTPDQPRRDRRLDCALTGTAALRVNCNRLQRD